MIVWVHAHCHNPNVTFVDHKIWLYASYILLDARVGGLSGQVPGFMGYLSWGDELLTLEKEKSMIWFLHYVSAVM